MRRCYVLERTNRRTGSRGSNRAVPRRDRRYRRANRFPVKPEEIVNAGQDYREQLFEYGVVTVREGVRAAWLSYDG